VPLSCCSPEYCQMAIVHAKEQWGFDLVAYVKDQWGVDVRDIEPAKLPFMSDKGCVVPPHLRPNCTLHACCINSLGFKQGDTKWTDRYFAIREEIETLEAELYVPK